MSHRLFVYGTLRNPRVYEYVAEEPCPPLRPALARGFRYGDPVNGYPAITPDENSEVEGYILEDVSDEALIRLDAYEGVGIDYERREANVIANGETLTAFVYVGFSYGGQ